jgi:hypothetical protein
MEKWQIQMFFFKLIKLGVRYPGRPNWGSPVEWVIEQMCMYQDQFLARIIGDYTNESHECRLNNAGLKMFWKVKGPHRCFYARIGGDQAKDYPEFVKAANTLIKEFGFLEERR